MREDRTQVSLGWFVLLACLIHVLIPFLVLAPSEIKSVLSGKKTTTKEVELVDPRLFEEKEVVETSKLKKEDPELSKNKARYYSDKKSRVKEETKSPFNGKFEQGTVIARGGREAGEEAPLSEEGEKSQTTKGSGDPSLKDLMLFSKTPNALSKDIREGSETVLNTDKVLYASFINRIAEEVYQPWVSNLENAIREEKAKNKKLENNLYVTKLLVTLDKEGEIQGIKVMRSSGNVEVDDAPKRAFWSLEGFKNPPSQLLKEDGFIRLTYEFHLEYKNSGFNIISDRL